jgi:hypothetical protein
MESKILNDLRLIIRRSMSDITFCDRDILDLEEDFRLVLKIPKGKKLSETQKQMRRDLIDFRRRNFIKTFFSSIRSYYSVHERYFIRRKKNDQKL